MRFTQIVLKVNCNRWTGSLIGQTTLMPLVTAERWVQEGRAEYPPLSPVRQQAESASSRP